MRVVWHRAQGNAQGTLHRSPQGTGSTQATVKHMHKSECMHCSIAMQLTAVVLCRAVRLLMDGIETTLQYTEHSARLAIIEWSKCQSQFILNSYRCSGELVGQLHSDTAITTGSHWQPLAAQHYNNFGHNICVALSNA